MGYFVMFSHHIATIALVSGSFLSGYLRIGILVLFVHDLSDIAVDVLKLANYVRLEGSKGFFVSEIVFVITLIAWFWIRLWIFPGRVIYSALIESRIWLVHNGNFPGFWESWT